MEIRLNKFIKESGLCSRREADKLVNDGRVLVNGKPGINGMIIDDEIHRVFIDNREIKINNNKFYILFNKPENVTCTRKAQGGEKTIYDYVRLNTHFFSLGRLDKDSKGLLILSNDGDIVNKNMASRYNIEKEYLVDVNKNITPEFLYSMRNGVKILDRITKKCKVKKIGNKRFSIILTEGINRQIRRMCEENNYKVLVLKRIRINNIYLNDLKEGQWRFLRKEEINSLKNN